MSTISVPREASTVVILRPAPDHPHTGFEVLMVHRHPGSLFVPDCYVFPGGCIDDDDCSEEMAPWCSGLDRERAYAILGDMPSAAMALGAWVAAIRETYEETGILLADINADINNDGPKLSSYRRQLLAGQITFPEIISREKWLLAAEHLHYFAHWITPEFLPYRYDVRFFAAKAPDNQEALSDGIELTGHVWITPQHALHEYEQNRFNIVLPTIMTLRELASHRSIDDVISMAAAKEVPSILTKVAKKEGRLVEIMPDGTIFSPVR